MQLLFVIPFIAALYYLFRKGRIWIALLSFGGFYGLRSFLLNNIKSSSNTFMTVLDYQISSASFFAFLVALIGTIYLSNKGD